MRLGRALGLGAAAALAGVWIFAALSGYDPILDVHPELAGLGPGAGHWLGTDHLGRDVLRRLMLASHSFVGPGLMSCAVALSVALPLGALSGYLGGPAAALLRLPLSSIASIPRFVWVLLACTILTPSASVLSIAAGLAYAPALSGALSARVEALRQAEFVLALRAHGYAGWEILGHQILWVNCRRLVARHLLHLFSFFLTLETSLSYIGNFGVAEPSPSWGNMLSFSFDRLDNPLAATAPALALWITALGLSLLASDLERSDG